MTEKMPLLIGTSNPGKIREIMYFLGDLPFVFQSLTDLSRKPKIVDETEATLEGNALLKAQRYAEQTGCVTMADDTGLFLDAFDGWPGVQSSRIAEMESDRLALVMDKVKSIPSDQRTGTFRTALALFDPVSTNSFCTTGAMAGSVLGEKKGDGGFGYDTLFYLPAIEKTYAELNTEEKNAISHRGKALLKMKHFLQKQYRPEHIVVPIALIIRGDKILASLRNDPHRSDFHRKWEFPGGSIELNEKPEEALQREVKEETGYEVEVVRLLQHIQVKWLPDIRYQVYLIPYVCRIVGGQEECSDAEILEMRWFDLQELRQEVMVGENNQMYEHLLPEIQNIMKENTF